MGIHHREVNAVVSRAVFLDRDGIINYPLVRDGRPYPPQSIEEFQFINGIEEVVRELQARHFLLFIVTNQPDVARGTTPKSVVESFHAKILSELPIQAIYTCYHDDADGCICRKPRPGLLYQAREHYALDLDRSFLIGDRWRDIDCGNQAGCTTIFVDYGYQESLKTEPRFKVASVLEILQCVD